MAESFKKEFGFTTHAYTKQLNDKYRTQRDEIEQAVHSRKDFLSSSILWKKDEKD